MGPTDMIFSLQNDFLNPFSQNFNANLGFYLPQESKTLFLINVAVAVAVPKLDVAGWAYGPAHCGWLGIRGGGGRREEGGGGEVEPGEHLPGAGGGLYEGLVVGGRELLGGRLHPRQLLRHPLRLLGRGGGRGGGGGGGGVEV